MLPTRGAGAARRGTEREYLNFLERNAPAERPDKMSAWCEFLGVRDEPFMPSFHAEVLEGEDLLETAGDIDAFATLIASRRLAPPLSIGLFGDWGSGKSFFMKRVQAGVAERAARKQPEFYDRIVQIEFNAWHYVEANLWASLTEHIFRNLRLTTEPPGMSAEKRREHVLTKLDQEIAARNAAQLKLEQAESARDRAAHGRAEARPSWTRRRRPPMPRPAACPPYARRTSGTWCGSTRPCTTS